MESLIVKGLSGLRRRFSVSLGGGRGRSNTLLILWTGALQVVLCFVTPRDGFLNKLPGALWKGKTESRSSPPLM